MPLGGGDGGGKNCYDSIIPFFDASRHKNIGATIPIRQEILCRPYAEFFLQSFGTFLRKNTL